MKSNNQDFETEVKGEFMELSYIREFVVLAETGNYLEAADVLFIAQSSLSRHIKSIEADLGAPLFDRTTRKVSLNGFGQAFLPYAKKMVDIQEDYENVLQSYLSGISSAITVASIPSMVRYNITDVLAGFKQANPRYKLNILEADSSQTLQLLLEEKCECGFVRDKDGLFDGFNKILFTTDHLVAVLPKSHPLSGNDYLSLDEIREEPFLFLNKNTTMYTICANACREAGFEPNVAFTGLRGENLIDLVAKGMGVALLTKRPIANLVPENVVLVDVVPYVTTSICLVYPRQKKLAEPLKSFLSYVQNYVKENETVSQT